MNSDAKVKAVQEFLELLHPGRLTQFDSKEVLRLATRFQRIEPAFRDARGDAGGRPYRISVMATLSTQHFISVFKLFLYSEGFFPDIKATGFDGIATEGMDPEDPFWESSPEALLILPALDDIKTWPRMFCSQEEIDYWVRKNCQMYFDVWARAAERFPGCRIYHALFPCPSERVLGNLERRYPFSRSNCLAALNEGLANGAPPSVTMVDFEALSGLIGSRQWTDEVAYFTSKQIMSIREMPLVATQISRLMASSVGMVKKCLVLDLDNTLWGGVIGDDGVEGIRLDPGDAVGEAFLAFQRYILRLKERGVLLAVCSKNDLETAYRTFRQHPDIVLSEDDFVAFVANWDDKASNLRQIAKDLSIGVDSLVFFDDNPAERALVRQLVPEVMVIEVPEDPALFVRALDSSFAFEWHELTEEDLGRSESYVNDRKRQALETSVEDYDSYLRSLEMRMHVERTTAPAFARFAQLSNKTNQFNLRTIRYTDEDIFRLTQSSSHRLIHVRLTDRFTNFGIIACVVISYLGDIAFVENWVMSCRVFKRGVEFATFNAIVDCARSDGAKWVAAEYIRTEKNSYVESLLDGLGLVKWTLAHELPDRPAVIGGGQAYIRLLSELAPLPHLIDLRVGDYGN